MESRDARRLHPRDTGPGPGAGVDRAPERSSMLHARIAIVATIVVGQLWGLTVALDRYFGWKTVAWLVVFQAISFALAVLVWLAATKDR